MPSCTGRVCEVYSSTKLVIERRWCRGRLVVNLNCRTIADEDIGLLALKRMVLGQKVTVRFPRYDDDGSVTGVVYYDKINVNMYLGDTGEHRNSLSQIRSQFPLRKKDL